MKIGYPEAPPRALLGDSLHPGLANVHGISDEDASNTVKQCH